MTVTLQVEGLRELQKALKQMSDETPKVIQEAHKEVAGIVVREAQTNTDSSELRGRIKAFGTTRRAGVRFSGHRPRGSATTDAFLQEFGGRAPLFGNKNHWFTVKESRKGGYIIYPAIRDTRERMVDAYMEKLDESIQRHWRQSAFSRVV